MLVFVAVMIATLGLVFVLENLRPRRPAHRRRASLLDAVPRKTMDELATMPRRQRLAAARPPLTR